jgi:N-acetylglutamate synthase-like GNAT family acetyltransferase
MVRSATDLDCAAVREVVLSSVDASCDTYSFQQIEAWRNAVSSKDFAAVIEATSSFVALEDGAVIGFANLISRDDKNGEIDLLYVNAKFRRLGAGTALVHVVEKHARENSMSQLWADASLPASPLFERLGYRMVERYIKSVGVVTFENAWFKKPLDGHRASSFTR